MRSQSIQVENEAVCALKLLQDLTKQEYILQHELTCHPGFLLSPEAHASRSFAEQAGGSARIQLVLTHEHHLWQPILDLRVVADCRNMCNG